jgi:DNA-binding HxlR family transcriptional regulator
MKRRSYSQYCGVAHALDIVGERWTLLIVRDLLLGPRRYSDLLSGLPGITTNLLAKRLREMEEAGLVERNGGSAAQRAWRLTTVGAGLEPTVQALASFGWQFVGARAKGETASIDWLLVALRNRYRGGKSLRAELVVDGAPYRVILGESMAEIGRGEVPSPDLRIRGSALAIYRLFREPPGRGQATTGLEIEGSRQDLLMLVRSFDLGSLLAV